MECTRSRRFVLLLLEKGHPVKLNLGLVDTFCNCRVGKEVAQVIVVRGVLEAKIPHIGQVCVELRWEALAQFRNWGGLLLLANLFVLLLISGCLQSLPWQTAPQKVHKYMAKCLQIIASGLLPTKMGVNAHISCCSGERFPLPVWDVLLRFGVSVLLRHSKVHDVNYFFAGVLLAGSVAQLSDQEVIGLNIAVDKVLLVDCLDTGELKKRISAHADTWPKMGRGGAR